MTGEIFMKKRVMAVNAVLVFALLLSGCGAESAAAYPVKIADVTQREMITQVEVSGNVELKEPVRIYASNNGKIKQVLVSEGDYVKKGQVLFTYDEDNTDTVTNQLDDARLTVRQLEEELKGLTIPADDSEIKSALAQITSCEKNIDEIACQLETDNTNIVQAKTALARAQEDYDKNMRLYEGGVIAQSELNTYKDKLTEAQAQLDNCTTQYNRDSLSYASAQAELEAAKTKHTELVEKPKSAQVKNQCDTMKVQLEAAKLKVKQLEDELAKYKTQEVSPFDGRVSKVNQNDGATVLEDTSVLEMVNENDTRVYIDIPEPDMPGISEGLDVILTGDGFKGEIKAKIKTVKFEAEEKQIDGTTRNVVEAELDVSDKAMLRPGYTLDAKVIKAVDKNAVVIPVMSYLTDESGKDYVFVINSENKLEKRPVTLKEYSDMYISADGVKAGERVVDSPDDVILKEGMQVKDIEEAAAE